MFNLNPQTVKQLTRFRSIKRGYYSAVLLLVLLILCAIGELLINSRALIVKYEGHYYFPTYSAFLPGTTFGQKYRYETNYRMLQHQFLNQQQAPRSIETEPNSDNWVVMPPVPYNPYETDLKEVSFPPYPPNASEKHYLGTDTTGRDVLARLFYGFRIAMLFSIILLVANYAIGIAIGCAMGFWGGKFDLFFQRLIEIWSNVPPLYVIMIIASVIVPNFWTLIGVMVLLGWMSMTWYMRTTTYKEKAREYVMAAQALGATTPRIIFSHILPNSISVIITFVPFSIATGITALTALDYLGFGLPPPTPSWGEMLSQGTSNLESPWIVSSVVAAMTAVLLMVTYVGEAIREAFDPKKFTYYE